MVLKAKRLELQQVFQKTLAETREWPTALELVRSCSAGRIYLVGGFIYRHLLRHLYGTPVKKGVDLDFVVETRRDAPMGLPWEITATSFGGPRFRHGDIVVDIWSLAECRGFKAHNRPLAIESYLACVPLSIQSNAYDVGTGTLLGDVGLQSILTRTLAPNCPWCLDKTCAHLGTSREAYLAKKASSLGFSVAEKPAACA